MPSIRDIIRDALADINAIEPGDQPTAEDAEDARARLVSMMRGWAADGLTLTVLDPADGEPVPYSVPDLTLDDAWPLDDSQVEGVQAMLSVRLSPSFGNQVGPDLRGRAKVGRRRLNAAYYPEPTISPQGPRTGYGTYRAYRTH